MSGHSSSSSSKPLILELTEEDKALQAIAVRSSLLQLSAFAQQVGFQSELFEDLEGFLGDFGTREAIKKDLQGIGGLTEEVSSELAREEERAQLQSELLRSEIDRIESGGAPSPQQLEAIRTATASSLASGESDIEDFARRNLEILREELAPERGLRSSDSPILDRGESVVSEAVRQQGQLRRNLATAEQQAILGLPLQTSAANQGTLGLLQDFEQFQTGLKDQGFLARLGLAGELGLGVSTAGNLPGTVAAVKQPKVAGQVSKEKSAGGGIGGG